jgi:hypothetical protein
MAFDLDSHASPRLYKRHQRHSQDGRLRHSKQFGEFLEVEATRLSTTTDVLYAKLDTYTADQIRAASSLSDLP